MVKKTARLALYTALSLIMFMLESLLPPLFFFAPGTKLGLSVVFVTLTLLIYGEKEALMVLTAKCLLGAMFGGGALSLLYSVPASLVSLAFAVLWARFFYRKIGAVAAGAVCAVLHNTVQLTVAVFVYRTPALFLYLPLASAAGLLAGTVTGLAVYFILKALPKRLIE